MTALYRILSYFSVCTVVGLCLGIRSVHAAAPSLSIVSPQMESITSSKVDVQMRVESFFLDAKPSVEENRGVIALYLDGKFYTTVATASATVYLPRQGTHRIDAELVHVSRQPIIPPVRASVFVHNQVKTPYLSISNIRNGSTLFTSTPTLQIQKRTERYEDQNTYYQVFVDGVVDGDSSSLSNPEEYVLKRPLTEGKHTIRVALYSENGRPYVPVVDTVADVRFDSRSPTIVSVALEEDTRTRTASFSAQITGFSIPEDGYLVAHTPLRSWVYTSSEGVLTDLSEGASVITFGLVDLTGQPIIPPVEAQQRVLIGEGPVSDARDVVLERNLMFSAPEYIVEPRTGLIIFALAQALFILLLGFYFNARHHHH